MAALIQLTLDGSLVQDSHKVSMRVLGQSMTALQSAADRAYLDLLHGNVWKHQRLHHSKRADADFLVGDYYEGSFVIEFLSEQGREIVDRIRKAINDPYQTAIAGGEGEIYSITRQVDARKGSVENRILIPQEYQQFLHNPDELATRTYGDKSINKEIDQMLTAVRKDPDAQLKLVLKPSEEVAAETFVFDQDTAIAFGRIVAQRQLGNPVIFHGQLRQLDRGHNQRSNFKGKFINNENDKDVVIHIQSLEDFLTLVPYMNGDMFKIIACPIIEFSSFDQTAGDIQFLGIHEDE